jgi:uncharacterized membrane protein
MGGMLAASLIAILIVPVSFYVIERLSHRGDDPNKPRAAAAAGEAKTSGD